jgi:lipopolysaccharide/colanic/teichoic acid biosynthesis glycosyltransferase
LNDLAVSFTSFIHTAARGEKRVIAFLDTESRRVGRVVNGVAVLGRPAHLDAIIEEFATHGVCTDQVAVSGAPNLLSKEDMVEVHRVCAQRNLDLLFLDRIFGQALAPTIDNSGEAKLTCSNVNGRGLVLSFYFRVKRAVDFFASVASLALLSPLWLLAASLTWFFVGSPILFWQQRMGLDGRSFDLYKMRTLRPPFDREGQKLCEAERLSCVGWLLRVTRIDELPQLLNVINGDMSLIGPRPLLPQDQPANPAARLTVRPGITGWAQVNGGGLLSPGEKETLDLWYIQNASFWFDLRIISMTFLSVIRGDRRNERALARARAATVMDRSGVRKEEEDLLVLGVDLNPTARHGIPATATAAAQSD